MNGDEIEQYVDGYFREHDADEYKERVANALRKQDEMIVNAQPEEGRNYSWILWTAIAIVLIYVFIIR